MQENTNLLPCPFCGGVPILDNSSEDCRVLCNNCDAESDPRNNYELDRTMAQAITAWNHRPVEDALRDENACLREEIQRLTCASK